MEITLRPLKEEDAYKSVRWRNDPEVFKFTGNTYKNIITLENELEWIRKVIAKPNDYRCAIIADDSYIGNVYLTDINKLKGAATFHIFIGEKEYWGKGIGEKTTRKMVKLAFDKFGLSSVNLKVRLQNTGALRVYEKVGFKELYTDDEFKYMEITEKDCK